MRLGGYKFYWNPEKYTIPEPDKYQAIVKTYSGVGFFSWGLDIIGKRIVLEWEWMTAAQYNQLRDLYERDEQLVWDTESGIYDKYYVEVLNMEGKMFDVAHTELAYRRQVKMELMLMSITTDTQTTTTT